jgi:hypothetical protein
MREEEALAFSPIWISTLVLLEKSYLAINYVKIRKYYLKSLVFSIIRSKFSELNSILRLSKSHSEVGSILHQPLFVFALFVEAMRLVW